MHRRHAGRPSWSIRTDPETGAQVGSSSGIDACTAGHADGPLCLRGSVDLADGYEPIEAGLVPANLSQFLRICRDEIKIRGLFLPLIAIDDG